jgi:hypothetical protein
MGYFPTSIFFVMIIRMNEISNKTSPNDSTSMSSGNTAAIEAVQRLLRPLVRLLLAKQITYPYLIGLLKPLFVDVAAKEFQLAGKQQTDSRLSLLTGVHRKDIRRLLNEPQIDLTPPVNVSLGARLIARWSGESDYLDAQALPKPLPRLAQADGSPSFERLVSDESKDIRARAVLDEWLRLGLVNLDANDVVRLRTGAFVPEHGLEEKLYYLGRNVRDHIESAVHNVLDETPPLMERSVYSNGLSQTAIEELAQMAETMGMDMLRAINQKAQELKKTSPGDIPTNRMTLGIYFYTDATLERKNKPCD